MALTLPRSEERIGLILAIAAHAALLALLLLQPMTRPAVPKPERMTVTLADEAGLTTTSPEPQSQAAPATAPTLAPVPEPMPEPQPEPLPQPTPEPAVRPQPKLAVAPKTEPRPLPRATQSPLPKQARTQPRPQPSPRPAARPPGGSRIGNDFLGGVPNAAASGASRNQPAAAIGPQARASFAQAVLRQVKPNWQGRVPQGVNTERLVTILSIELNRDGTLAGPPSVMRQEGIDDSNRAQAQRHAEAAIKAVQLSQPFNLPPELYEGWRRLPPLRFRKNS